MHKKTTSHTMDEAPAAWPVIELSMTDQLVTADPAGLAAPVEVPVMGDPFEAAREAALTALSVLQMPKCRVRGHGADGAVWVMVVDSEAGTLTELDAAPGAAGKLSIREWVQQYRWWWFSGFSVLCAAAVAAAFMLPTGETPEPVQAAPARAEIAPDAGAGQLPVAAPTGWDTYATRVFPVENRSTAGAVLASKVLVFADGSQVTGTDPMTGVTLWRTDVGAEVDRLAVSEDQRTIWAVSGVQQLAELHARDGNLVGTYPVEATRVDVGDSGVPFAELPGQSGAILTPKGWDTRQVPATSFPVGVAGEGLISVSPKSGRVWVTVSDDPILPPSASLDAPTDGVKLDTVLGYFSGHLISRWTGDNGASVLACHTVAVDGAVQACGAITESFGSAGTDVSFADGLAAIGGTVIDVQSFKVIAEGLSQPVTVSAGYAWAGNSDMRVQVDVSGKSVSVLDDAPIPDVVLANGQAVVRAPLAATGEGVYVLSTTEKAPQRTQQKDEGKKP